MDNALIQAYTNKIQNMTASEFDKMIAEMVETTENKSELKEKLALCGVELSIDKNVPISPMSLDDREVNFPIILQSVVEKIITGYIQQ